MDSVRIDRVQTKSQHYGLLWINQLNKIHHSTSTSLTTKKAFDSVDRTTLWMLLRHHGVLE
ncbi:unnamed protein product [Schistosoma margrebowiei]|uniref:Uncharacterized protein n=1 Tax=Schistosoma margrebowiei TaxID=48269 RepID=A0A3P8HXE0_9TREM|nr:unnamed protein product [Schistosoma margrebowiei]